MVLGGDPQGLAVMAVLAGALAGDRDVDAVILQDALQQPDIGESRHALRRVSVSSLSSEAIIKGSAAFLAPLIGMVPLSLLPPRMRMRSMS